MKTTLLTLLLAAMSTGAMAEWERWGGDENTVLYIDRSTIRTDGNTVKMRNLFDFKKAQVQAGKTYLSVEMHEEYDCAKRLVRGIGATVFAENMARGEMVVSDTYYDWMPVEPGTTSDGLWKTACERK